jgi:hypothetical protein
MSMTKRYMDEIDDKRSAALAIAIQAGVIKECEFHDGCYFDGGEDIEEAYTLGVKMFADGEVSDHFDSPDEMKDFIKEVVEQNNAAEECTWCDKVFNED